MSIALQVNGQTFQYPEPGDTNWGVSATSWASAVTTGMLQKAAGTFTLTAEVDFGAGFGLKSLYYKTRTANIATAGQFRLARADVVSWRDQANSANLDLSVNASNELLFNGVNVVLATLASGNILVGSAGNVATSVAMSGDATLVASGAITIANNAVSNAKLAQMATLTIKGNSSGGTANASDLTGTQATSILVPFVGDSGTGGTKGLVPAPLTGDATKFLRGDGVFATPVGAGDVVGPASATANAPALFDGTTGKLIKDSGALGSNRQVYQIASGVPAWGNQFELLGSTSLSTGSNQTLTSASNPVQYVTPSADITYKLDNSFEKGRMITIVNLASAFTISIIANDNSVIRTVYPNTTGQVISNVATPAVTADWNGVGIVQSDWASYTLTIGADTTAPTPGTHTSLAVWRRNGQNMEWHYEFKQSVAGTAGTGSYRFPLPSGLSIDSAIIVPSGNGFSEGLCGTVGVRNGSIQRYGIVSAGGTGYFQFYYGDATAILSVVESGAFGVASNNTIYYIANAVVPISGWTSTKG